MADNGETIVGEKPDLGFDPEALRARYRAERDKRLRAEGNEQYVEMKGDFAHYLEDPYVTPIQRAPLFDEVEVVVVGGGFGGLLAAARLREAGVDGIRMIEKGGDFGGTWYWNRYPGAACDIESYIYLPLCEEIGYLPVEKYSRAAGNPEAQPRHRRALRPLPLTPCSRPKSPRCAGTTRAARWTVKTNKGDAMKARFVVMANGPLHRPSCRASPASRVSKGHSFHTSRWDYEYTGGDSTATWRA